MASKYQTSFDYKIEEKRMGFFKILFLLIIITIGGAYAYAHFVPSEKRMGWFNEGVEISNQYYKKSVLYVSEYIPAVGELTGIKPIKAEIKKDPARTAPLQPKAEKVKVYRSNKIETQQ